jgi:hypothetical protein
LFLCVSENFLFLYVDWLFEKIGSIMYFLPLLTQKGSMVVMLKKRKEEKKKGIPIFLFSEVLSGHFREARNNDSNQ